MQLTVSYHRDGDTHTIVTGGAALPQIVIDNSNVPADQRGGTAKQLLGAAALFCYASSLVAAMDTRALKYQHLDLSATLDVDANEKGQSRVQKITINANVSIDEEDLDLFDRVARVMKNGCLITGSLHDGIEMEYHLNAEYDD